MNREKVFIQKETEPRKPARQILSQQIAEGLSETERPEIDVDS